VQELIPESKRKWCNFADLSHHSSKRFVSKNLDRKFRGTFSKRAIPAKPRLMFTLRVILVSILRFQRFFTKYVLGQFQEIYATQNKSYFITTKKYTTQKITTKQILFVAIPKRKNRVAIDIYTHIPKQRGHRYISLNFALSVLCNPWSLLHDTDHCISRSLISSNSFSA